MACHDATCATCVAAPLSMSGSEESLPLALTMGEPAGIGAEITLKAWSGRDAARPAFFVIDDPDRLRALAAQLSLGVPIIAVDDPREAVQAFARGLPVMPTRLAKPPRAGLPDAANAPAVI